jgi:hypothetical protein
LELRKTLLSFVQSVKRKTKKIMTTKIKLSDKQKEVIAKLRADDNKRIFYKQGYNSWAMFTRCQGIEIVSVATVSALWRLKVIDTDGSEQKRLSSFSLSLTELGKTIEL